MSSFDVYTDANPKDTISMKYATTKDVKETIAKLERLYKAKEYPHRRIFQVASIMRTRLRLSEPPKEKQYKVADKYFNFLKKRTTLSEEDRFKLKFV